MTDSIPLSTPDHTTGAPAGTPWKHHRTALAIGAAGLAVAATLGLAACSSTGGSGSSTPSTSSAASGTTSKQPGGARHEGAAGTIASITPGSWTLTKRDGGTETVTITPSTQFGSNQHPATQSQFTVGEAVRVEGQVEGATITATRIEQAQNRSQPGTTPSGGAPTSSAPTTN
ncbi:hypothetical protein IU500_09245 [Nocardia terpenica]|uniref:DUF5666 domain-containing protein n=1 Tax=Nocardia terpenica TaxID=455432 RepID=UPI0018956F27|nr:DUF5666 domain-containing protein [Nocardia terpenica]MBF6062137.1 hypothetical protein [Nocardia terpenica]MBF6104225.1 hypothetical protein [Nocardia terpenica]MBF6109919.1 hypothetical protein [Nocardia terpenica]MBF6120225.1 hypothetical protein [Nocardia terpenica]MBF6152636.1 hypothetical protein [Nocardia terpenica]